MHETPEVETREHPPLPASERDLRWKQASRNPRFRLALIVGGIVLLVAGFFLWRYLGSYESTDDAQIDGHLNAISTRVSGHVDQASGQRQPVCGGRNAPGRDRSQGLSGGGGQGQGRLSGRPGHGGIHAGERSDHVGEHRQPVVRRPRRKWRADAPEFPWRASNSKRARAQLEQAIANDIKAQNDVGRYKQLVDKQEISHQQYDQAVAAARSSAAGVAAARASAAAAEQMVSQAQAKREQAEANLRSAETAPQQLSAMRSRAQAAQAQAQQKKAELEQATLNLQYTRLVAPVNGIVSNRTVEVGQNVQIGQELMKIINLDDIWVTANFKESQLRYMRPGQRATISVDAYGKKYNGHVESIAGASGALFSLLPPENATGNYVKVVQRIPVKITFDPGETKEHILRPGMSVEPKVWSCR